jgi:hypothetical protein
MKPMRLLGACAAVLAGWVLAGVSPALAQAQSDNLSVIQNNNQIGPGAIPEGREAIQIVNLGVFANVNNIDIVLTEPNGDPSDVVSVVRLAGNQVQLLFTSDTNDLIIVPAGAIPMPELIGPMNLTRALFPNFAAGAEPAQVVVTSDPDVVLAAEPHALGAIALGLGLTAWRFRRGRGKTARHS